MTRNSVKDRKSCTPLYHDDDLQHFDKPKIEKSQVPRVKTIYKSKAYNSWTSLSDLDKKLLIMVMIRTN